MYSYGLNGTADDDVSRYSIVGARRASDLAPRDEIVVDDAGEDAVVERVVCRARGERPGAPSACLVCGSHLTWHGNDLVCDSSECPIAKLERGVRGS